MLLSRKSTVEEEMQNFPFHCKKKGRNFQNESHTKESRVTPECDHTPYWRQFVSEELS